MAKSKKNISKQFDLPEEKKGFELLNDQTFLIKEYATDKTYGYTVENPVLVGVNDDHDLFCAIDETLNQRRFLNALAGPAGEQISYQRVGVGLAPTQDCRKIETYQIKYESLETPIILYIKACKSDDVLKVPVGFTLKEIEMSLTVANRTLVKLKIDAIGSFTIDWGDGAIKQFIGDGKEFSESYIRCSHLYTNGNEPDWLCTIRLKGNNIRGLHCNGNQITSLDVSKNSALISLNCDNNLLTSLDVSKNDAMIQLSCPDNQIKNFIFSNNGTLMLLDCERNQLSNLDVSKNSKLISLYCSENQLTSLDFSKNGKLARVYCDNNQLTTLDISKNSRMKWLYCNNNQLTSLDLSNNTNLTWFDCSDNQLTNLDVSKNSALETLRCDNNKLSTSALNILFDGLHNKGGGVSINDNPGFLDCDTIIASTKGWLVYDAYNSCKIKMTTVSDNLCISLKGTGYGIVELGDGQDDITLPIDEKEWTQFDIEYPVGTINIITVYGDNITGLNCSDIQLKRLDVSKNVELKELDCNLNLLTDLDVSQNLALTRLVCNNNPLKSLDVSKNRKLKELICSQLTTLDVSKNIALRSLDCPGSVGIGSHSRLTALDVSKNTKLKELRCYCNDITNLDVSKNSKLKELYCEGNKLTSLDVSKSNELTELNCSYNLLTNLDVSKSNKLTVLCCRNNLLTNLDVSKSNVLTVLDCSNNLLTDLDVSKNKMLVSLSCIECKLSETALNDLFETLPKNKKEKKILIFGNPGTNDCNKTIAEKKKWKFTEY